MPAVTIRSDCHTARSDLTTFSADSALLPAERRKPKDKLPKTQKGYIMKKFLKSQFGLPRGAFGWLAGKVMAYNNRERAAWAVTLLQVQPRQKILEIGYGPGLALQILCERCPSASLTGIDASIVMCRQASHRNRKAIAAGQLSVQHGSVAQLPFADASFDGIFAINSLHHWPNPPANLLEVRRVLKQGGQLTLVEQPRMSKRSGSELQQLVGDRLTHMLRQAGFDIINLSSRVMKPHPCIAAQAIKPSQKNDRDCRHVYSNFNQKGDPL